MRSAGCFLATCVKPPSGAKCSARKAFALLFALCFCFSVPAYANLSQTFDYVNGGFFYPSAVSPFNFVIGGQDVSPFSGYMSATFDSSSKDGYAWLFVGDKIPGLTSQLKIVDGTYLEILFNVTSAQSISVSSPSSSNYASFKVGYTPNSYGEHNFYSPKYSSVEFIYDSSEVPCSLTGTQIYIPDGTYKVARYFGFRFNFLASTFNPNENNVALCMRLSSNANFSAQEWPTGDIIGSIDINTGVLQEIAGDVSDIKTQLTQLNQDISDIKDTVSDTNNQLQDPNSNIWQAAGTAISDAVTGLFVPEQAELDAKMKEVENIVINKMGDTYEVIQKTQVYEDEFVSGFTGSGSDYTFHFPGISVPLPDGTVGILPEQNVNLQNKAFNVFRNMLGTIVAVLCGFSAVHLGHDFIICIFSGVSYWGFLRSRHDR